MSKPSDLVQGTLDVLIPEDPRARAVARLGHRPAPAAGVRRGPPGQRGSLYPALHKLENEGWITAEWKLTDNNRRAKFYSLTRPGRRHLDRKPANWDRLSSAITGVMRLDEVERRHGPPARR